MPKIEVRNPVVELDGGETTCGIWNEIRERLILPYVEVDLRYYDLGAESRGPGNDAESADVVRAIEDSGVAVRSAAAVSDATICKGLRATVFRETIACANFVKSPGDVPAPIFAHRARGSDDDANESIRDFARACFNYGLYRAYPVYFSTPDARAKNAFEETYEQEFRSKYIGSGLAYEYRSFDDLAAVAGKADGKLVWAADRSDDRSFGSHGITSSVSMTHDGMTLVAGGGQAAPANPISSIFAWTRGLWHRGRLDRSHDLIWFAQTLERVCLELVEAGRMTADLAALAGPDRPRLTAEEYLAETDRELGRRISLVESARP